MLRLCAPLSVLVLLVASTARADDGGDAEDGGLCRALDTAVHPVDVFPSLGGDGVRLDAQIRAVFPHDVLAGLTPGEAGTAISLSRCEDEDCFARTPVKGRAEIHLDSLVFVPSELLTADADYIGEAVGEDGSLSFGFHTGGAVDERPPVLPGYSKHHVSRFRGACPGEVGFRVEFDTAPASDDGPADDIEYLLYLTRGPTVTAPELMARRRAAPGGFNISLAAFLDKEQAASPVCFTIRAVDGAGNEDAGNKLVCVNPRGPVGFRGICATRTPAAGGGNPWIPCIAFGGLGLIVALRARRRRPRT